MLMMAWVFIQASGLTLFHVPLLNVYPHVRRFRLDIAGTSHAIRLMHESAISRHDQWLPRCRSNIGIGKEIVGSFLLVLNSTALYAIWNMLCNLISE